MNTFDREEKACRELRARLERQAASAQRVHAYLQVEFPVVGGLIADYIDDMAALERREQALEAGRDARNVASAALPRYVYRPAQPRWGYRL